MQRIAQATENTTDPRARELLEETQKKLGRVPNLFSTLAHSPAALEAYLKTGEILAGGVLSAEVREKVALTVAGVNECGYCASAHTALGKSLDIDAAELDLNLAGESADARTDAMLALVGAILDTQGDVSDDELAAARAAGITDAEVAELVALVSLNVFTNYFNRLAKTEIDFPVISIEESLQRAASAAV